MKRLSTGNEPLDRILCGGFPGQSINIVMGLPGTGKTILAEQVAFANATPERPALYLSTLSEPMAKMVSYLGGLDFADVERVGVDVIYEALDERLRDDPANLIEAVRELILTHRPGIVVVDSLKAVSELMPDRRHWRVLLFELASLLTAYDALSLWVGEYPSESISRFAEFAVADGVLALTREERGTRDERYLQVIKYRGSSFLDGKHALEIDSSGLSVYPRLVVPRAAIEYDPIDERLSTGIKGLDDMIESGWLRGTTTLVAGPAGAGKTMVGLNFLRAGVDAEEPGLLVTFQESPIQLRRLMESLGWNQDELIRPEGLDVLYISPVEMQIDTIVMELYRRIQSNGVRRLVIDALGDVQKASIDSVRFHEYVYVLTQEIARRRITAMFVAESIGPMFTDPADELGSDISNMSDNVVLLEMNLQDDLARTVRIIKTRASAHDGRRRRLVLSADGISID